MIATPFAGNVPEFDVLATDEHCRTVPIQVKASRHRDWPTKATNWLDLELIDGRQECRGPKQIDNPDLIYICVWISSTAADRDRFFVLTKPTFNDWRLNHTRHGWNLGTGDGRKTLPRFDNRYYLEGLAPFEDNWELIQSRFDDANTVGAGS